MKGTRLQSSAFPPKILLLFFGLRDTQVSHNSPWNTDFFFFSFFFFNGARMSLHALTAASTLDDKPGCVALASEKSLATVNLSSLAKRWESMPRSKWGLNV